MKRPGTRQRRLLFLITSMARGGAERQVVDLAVALGRRRWKISVASMIPPTDYQTELSDAGVRLVSLEMRQGHPSLRGLTRYVHIVRRWRPDVVHAHMVHANLLARTGRILVPSVPVISTVHNVSEGARWREWAYRLTHAMSSETTAVSRAAAERYVAVGAVPAGGIVVVPNGFDPAHLADPIHRPATRRSLGLDDGLFAWLTVGRLVEAKGHDMLLEAFRRVRDAYPTCRLIIAGDGPERGQLLRRIEQLHLQDSVWLLGERRDVPALLASADAFVLSSRWEGLPMVLLEAAAHGLPIVSTDVGGCREVAVPELGAIVRAPNVGAIADGMLELMRQPRLRHAEIGDRLRQHVEAEFSLAAVVDRWEALYAAVQEGRRQS